MAVGHDPMECYQGEDVAWEFTVDGPAITGQDIELVIKETAAEPDPPLIGAVTCSITGAQTFLCEFNMDVDPGSFVYSARRVDVSWQYAHGTATVLDSASVDTAP